MLFPDWNNYKTFRPINYTVAEDSFVFLALDENNTIYINNIQFMTPHDYSIATMFLKKGDKLHTVNDVISAYIMPLVKSGGGLESYFLIVSLLSIMLDSLLNTEEVKHNV